MTASAGRLVRNATGCSAPEPPNGRHSSVSQCVPVACVGSLAALSRNPSAPGCWAASGESCGAGTAAAGGAAGMAAAGRNGCAAPLADLHQNQARLRAFA